MRDGQVGRGHGPLPQPLGPVPRRRRRQGGGGGARAAAANPATTDREKAYIAAIAEVFSDEAIKASQREDDQPDVEGYSEPSRPALVKYKEKMAALHAAWPDDDEATVFYALALNTTARRGDKTRADLRECTALLKPLFVKLPDHPGIAHYHHPLQRQPGDGRGSARRRAQVRGHRARLRPRHAHAVAHLRPARPVGRDGWSRTSPR